MVNFEGFRKVFIKKVFELNCEKWVGVIRWVGGRKGYFSGSNIKGLEKMYWVNVYLVCIVLDIRYMYINKLYMVFVFMGFIV